MEAWGSGTLGLGDSGRSGGRSWESGTDSFGTSGGNASHLTALG